MKNSCKLWWLRYLWISKFFSQKEAMSTSAHRLTLNPKLLIFPHKSHRHYYFAMPMFPDMESFNFLLSFVWKWSDFWFSDVFLVHRADSNKVNNSVGYIDCFEGLRRLVWISCHKWVLSYFTTSCSGVICHTTILFNIEITLEANSMKFCLVTYIFLKLFSKVFSFVTILESLIKMYLFLKKLQHFMYFPHSISIIKHVSYQELFSQKFAWWPM